ncbi:hypothetical protein [Dictyobacter halimunensis]
MTVQIIGNHDEEVTMDRSCAIPLCYALAPGAYRCPDLSDFQV